MQCLWSGREHHHHGCAMSVGVASMSNAKSEELKSEIRGCWLSNPSSLIIGRAALKTAALLIIIVTSAASGGEGRSTTSAPLAIPGSIFADDLTSHIDTARSTMRGTVAVATQGNYTLIVTMDYPETSMTYQNCFLLVHVHTDIVASMQLPQTTTTTTVSPSQVTLGAMSKSLSVGIHEIKLDFIGNLQGREFRKVCNQIYFYGAILVAEDTGFESETLFACADAILPSNDNLTDVPIDGSCHAEDLGIVRVGRDETSQWMRTFVPGSPCVWDLPQDIGARMLSITSGKVVMDVEVEMEEGGEIIFGTVSTFHETKIAMKRAEIEQKSSNSFSFVYDMAETTHWTILYDTDELSYQPTLGDTWIGNNTLTFMIGRDPAHTTCTLNRWQYFPPEFSPSHSEVTLPPTSDMIANSAMEIQLLARDSMNNPLAVLQDPYCLELIIGLVESENSMTLGDDYYLNVIRPTFVGGNSYVFEFTPIWSGRYVGFANYKSEKIANSSLDFYVEPAVVNAITCDECPQLCVAGEECVFNVGFLDMNNNVIHDALALCDESLSISVSSDSSFNDNDSSFISRNCSTIVNITAAGNATVAYFIDGGIQHTQDLTVLPASLEPSKTIVSIDTDLNNATIYLTAGESLSGTVDLRDSYMNGISCSNEDRRVWVRAAPIGGVTTSVTCLESMHHFSFSGTLSGNYTLTVCVKDSIDGACQFFQDFDAKVAPASVDFVGGLRISGVDVRDEIHYLYPDPDSEKVDIVCTVHDIFGNQVESISTTTTLTMKTEFVSCFHESGRCDNLIDASTMNDGYFTLSPTSPVSGYAIAVFSLCAASECQEFSGNQSFAYLSGTLDLNNSRLVYPDGLEAGSRLLISVLGLDSRHNFSEHLYSSVHLHQPNTTNAECSLLLSSSANFTHIDNFPEFNSTWECFTAQAGLHAVVLTITTDAGVLEEEKGMIVVSASRPDMVATMQSVNGAINLVMGQEQTVAIGLRDFGGNLCDEVHCQSLELSYEANNHTAAFVPTATHQGRCIFVMNATSLSSTDPQLRYEGSDAGWTIPLKFNLKPAVIDVGKSEVAGQASRYGDAGYSSSFLLLTYDRFGNPSGDGNISVVAENVAAGQHFDLEKTTLTLGRHRLLYNISRSGNYNITVHSDSETVIIGELTIRPLNVDPSSVTLAGSGWNGLVSGIEQHLGIQLMDVFGNPPSLHGAVLEPFAHCVGAPDVESLPLAFCDTEGDVNLCTFPVTFTAKGECIISVFLGDTPLLTRKVEIAPNELYLPATETKYRSHVVSGEHNYVQVVLHDAFGNIINDQCDKIRLDVRSVTESSLEASTAAGGAERSGCSFTYVTYQTGEFIISPHWLGGDTSESLANVSVTAIADVFHGPSSSIALRSGSIQTAGTITNITLRMHDEFGNTIQGLTASEFEWTVNGNLRLSQNSVEELLAGHYLFQITPVVSGSHSVKLTSIGSCSSETHCHLQPTMLDTIDFDVVPAALDLESVSVLYGDEFEEEPNTAGSNRNISMQIRDEYHNVIAPTESQEAFVDICHENGNSTSLDLLCGNLTCTATWIPQTSGDYMLYPHLVDEFGVSRNASHPKKIHVTPGPANTSHSTLIAVADTSAMEHTISASERIDFVVHFRDRFENSIAWPHNPSDIHVSLYSEDDEEDYATACLSIIRTQNDSGSSPTFRMSLSCRHAGRYALSMLYQDVPVLGSPQSVTVEPTVFNGTLSVASFSVGRGGVIKAGTSVDLVITLVDNYGNEVNPDNVEDLFEDWYLTVYVPSIGHTESVPIEKTSDGKLRAAANPIVTGLTFLIPENIPLAIPDRSITVLPGDIDPSKSFLIHNGTQNLRAGEFLSIQLRIHDEFMNVVTAITPTDIILRLVRRPDAHDSSGSIRTITLRGDSLVKKETTIQITKSGSYVLIAEFDGVHIGDSPANLLVTPSELDRGTSRVMVNDTYQVTDSFHSTANVPTSIVVSPRDVHNNTIVDDLVHWNVSILPQWRSHGDHHHVMPDTHANITVSRGDTGDVTFLVSAAKEGAYSVSIQYRGTVLLYGEQAALTWYNLPAQPPQVESYSPHLGPLDGQTVVQFWVRSFFRSGDIVCRWGDMESIGLILYEDDEVDLVLCESPPQAAAGLYSLEIVMASSSNSNIPGLAQYTSCGNMSFLFYEERSAPSIGRIFPTWSRASGGDTIRLVGSRSTGATTTTRQGQHYNFLLESDYARCIFYSCSEGPCEVASVAVEFVDTTEEDEVAIVCRTPPLRPQERRHRHLLNSSRKYFIAFSPNGQQVHDERLELAVVNYSPPQVTDDTPMDHPGLTTYPGETTEAPVLQNDIAAHGTMTLLNITSLSSSPSEFDVGIAHIVGEKIVFTPLADRGTVIVTYCAADEHGNSACANATFVVVNPLSVVGLNSGAGPVSIAQPFTSLSTLFRVDGDDPFFVVSMRITCFSSTSNVQCLGGQDGLSTVRLESCQDENAHMCWQVKDFIETIRQVLNELQVSSADTQVCLQLLSESSQLYRDRKCVTLSRSMASSSSGGGTVPPWQHTLAQSTKREGPTDAQVTISIVASSIGFAVFVLSVVLFRYRIMVMITTMTAEKYKRKEKEEKEEEEEEEERHEDDHSSPDPSDTRSRDVYRTSEEAQSEAIELDLMDDDHSVESVEEDDESIRRSSSEETSDEEKTIMARLRGKKERTIDNRFLSWFQFGENGGSGGGTLWSNIFNGKNKRANPKIPSPADADAPADMDLDHGGMTDIVGNSIGLVGGGSSVTDHDDEDIIEEEGGEEEGGEDVKVHVVLGSDEEITIHIGDEDAHSL